MHRNHCVICTRELKRRQPIPRRRPPLDPLESTEPVRAAHQLRQHAGQAVAPLEYANVPVCRRRCRGSDSLTEGRSRSAGESLRPFQSRRVDGTAAGIIAGSGLARTMLRRQPAGGQEGVAPPCSQRVLLKSASRVPLQDSLRRRGGTELHEQQRDVVDVNVAVVSVSPPASATDGGFELTADDVQRGRTHCECCSS